MVAWLAALVATSGFAKFSSWEDEVFYQIFPRSYRDSNGDGIGDFRGIEAGLPAIQKLGATAILINPIQKARVYHNYFADDWFDVDPTFGTLADFDHLVEAAHRARIKVVLDMEPQYVASGHPWYVAAAKDPNSPEAAYFAKPFKPNPDAPSPWYDHAKIQLAPLNLNHPVVVKKIHDLFHFWAARGVDGFRIDHMMDNLDWEGKSTNLYAKLWGPIEQEMKLTSDGTFFVGEQADWDSFRSPVEMFAQTPTDACFNFRFRNALMTNKAGVISKSLLEYKYFTKEGRLQLNFLENHDMNRFASEESDPRKQRLAAALMMFAKGAPILYYGQEIGMKGQQGQWNSDGNDIPVRLAYRWGDKLTSPGTALWYKNTGPWWSDRYSRDHDGRSLQEQENSPKSLYNWYRKLISIRQSHPGLRSGSQEVVDSLNESVVAFRRKLGTSSCLVLANLSDQAVTLAPSLANQGTDVIGETSVTKGQSIRLKPWQVRVIDER